MPKKNYVEEREEVEKERERVCPAVGVKKKKKRKGIVVGICLLLRLPLLLLLPDAEDFLGSVRRRIRSENDGHLSRGAGALVLHRSVQSD